MAGDRSRFPGYPLVLIVGFAAIVRIAHVWAINRAPFADVLIGDARAYDAWARELAGGEWLGEDVFYQAPLYPYFVGGIYKVFGTDPGWVRLAQAVLGSIACGLVALAGKCWFGVRSGVAAGAIAAVYAPAVFFDGLIQKSALDFFFMSALLLVLGRSRGTRESPWAFLSGVVLGAFCLTRENALLMVPWIALWFLVRASQGQRIRALTRAALFAAGLAIVLLPVGGRNYVVGGEFVLTTMQSGTNLWFGNNPEATGRHRPLREGREMPEFERADATAIAEAETGRRLTAREVSAWWRDRALEWIRSHPSDWLRLMARKTLIVWNRFELPDTESIQLHADASILLRTLNRVPAFGLVAPLAAVGIVLQRRRWRELWLLYGMLVVFTGAIALFYVFARYRFPLVPLLLLFAGVALTRGAEVIRDGPVKERLAAGVALAIALPLVWVPVVPNADPRPLDWYNVGTAHADRGNWDDAVVWLRRSVEALPDDPRVRYNLARSLQAKGDLQGAEHEFRRTISLDPSHAGARTNLGVLLARKGQLQDAREEFTESIRLDPTSVNAWNNLGNVELLEGRPEEAARCYRRAADFAPEWMDVRVNLASALLEAGRRQEAIVELRSVIERDPSRQDARDLLEKTLAE
jgi:tetratricopeptide (TPR) repeat protein